MSVCLCESVGWCESELMLVCGSVCDCRPMGEYESVCWLAWACVDLKLCDYGPGWVKA